jgi:hypothetical protein
LGARAGVLPGYRVGGRERIGVQLASGMGVPPSGMTRGDHHGGSIKVKFPKDLARRPGKQAFMLRLACLDAESFRSDHWAEYGLPTDLLKSGEGKFRQKRDSGEAGAKRAQSPEIPPVFPFSKGGELSGNSVENSFSFFTLWKRGTKERLKAFQKAKLFPNV